MFLRITVALTAMAFAAVGAVEADTAALKRDVETLLAQSQGWLATQQQANGAYAPGAKFAIGITGLAVEALASEPSYYTADPSKQQIAVDFLLGHQQANGGVYVDDEGLGNYGTALTLMALSTTKLGSPEQIKRMQEYLFGLQNSTADAPAEGGMGYGSKGPGHEDLSNTAMAVEGLRRSGVPANDPHMQKAMAFLERCQDLSSHNKLPWAGASGGGVYSPEESKAGGSWDAEAKPGDAKPVLTPYGGMTYQLISSYVALELKPGDPRLDAALGWAKAHYQFTSNPGMAAGKERQGLFYYYMAMAKSFDLLDQGGLTLADGRTVDWRFDLFQAIKANATTIDGGVVWINSQDRWAEGMPQVTAGYLIKALKRIHQSL